MMPCMCGDPGCWSCGPAQGYTGDDDKRAYDEAEADARVGTEGVTVSRDTATGRVVAEISFDPPMVFEEGQSINVAFRFDSAQYRK